MDKPEAHGLLFRLPVVGWSIRRAGRFRSHSLQRLPDHLLKDIGLTRSEILSVTRLGESDGTRRRRG